MAASGRLLGSAPGDHRGALLRICLQHTTLNLIPHLCEIPIKNLEIARIVMLRATYHVM